MQRMLPPVVRPMQLSLCLLWKKRVPIACSRPMKRSDKSVLELYFGGNSPRQQKQPGIDLTNPDPAGELNGGYERGRKH